MDQIERRYPDEELLRRIGLPINQPVHKEPADVRRGGAQETGQIFVAAQRGDGKLDSERPSLDQFVELQRHFNIVRLAQGRREDRGRFLGPEPQVVCGQPRGRAIGKAAVHAKPFGRPRANRDPQIGRRVACQIRKELGAGGLRRAVRLVNDQQDVLRKARCLGEPSGHGFKRIGEAL